VYIAIDIEIQSEGMCVEGQETELSDEMRVRVGARVAMFNEKRVYNLECIIIYSVECA
jgi:hypothetical protein